MNDDFRGKVTVQMKAYCDSCTKILLFEAPSSPYGPSPEWMRLRFDWHAVGAGNWRCGACERALWPDEPPKG